MLCSMVGEPNRPLYTTDGGWLEVLEESSSAPGGCGSSGQG
jgi:hypothetical protein